VSLFLGCYDTGISDDTINGYLKKLTEQSGLKDGKLVCDAGFRRLAPIEGEQLTVSGIQQILANAGFFPGGKTDGIFGYRTHSATRLFQEYVRACEQDNECLPDGIAGPQTNRHLLRWRDENLRASWNDTMLQWADDKLPADNSYSTWLAFLKSLKDRYVKNPTAELDLVNNFRDSTDTIAPKDWTFNKDQIHLIGIRRLEQDEKRKFDDIFVLLIRGLVFKFQGTTDPGSSSHKDGAPFLVTGQHTYRFGLHQSRYHALRPMNYATHGVLVVRSKGDFKLSETDLLKGVSANGTINIHWGGKGVGRSVNRWSEGCQVLTGSGYEDHQGNVIDCSSYVAMNNTKVKETRGKQSRGAYNVLGDLITALGSGLPTEGEIRYTLIHENDCQSDPAIASEITASLQRAARFIAKLT